MFNFLLKGSQQASTEPTDAAEPSPAPTLTPNEVQHSCNELYYSNHGQRWQTC